MNWVNEWKGVSQECHKSKFQSMKSYRAKMARWHLQRERSPASRWAVMVAVRAAAQICCLHRWQILTMWSCHQRNRAHCIHTQRILSMHWWVVFIEINRIFIFIRLHRMQCRDLRLEQMTWPRWRKHIYFSPRTCSVCIVWTYFCHRWHSWIWMAARWTRCVIWALNWVSSTWTLVDVDFTV